MIVSSPAAPGPSPSECHVSQFECHVILSECHVSDPEFHINHSDCHVSLVSERTCHVFYGMHLMCVHEKMKNTIVYFEILISQNNSNSNNSNTNTNKY